MSHARWGAADIVGSIKNPPNSLSLVDFDGVKVNEEEGDIFFSLITTIHYGD
jgi:hypothetical protein